MKINKLIKAFSLLLVVAFAACSDFEDTITDSPQRPAGNQGVYFPTSNPSLFELEPAAATQVTLKVARELSSGAVQVPITVETNDSSVFNVPQSVSFADGETEVSFTVTFPDAAEGVAYNLKLSVVGDDLVNPYASALSNLSTVVSRIKWSPVGRPLVYKDGAFLALFGVSSLPMYVEADSVELESSIRYRLKNAYRIPTSETPDEDGIYDGYPYNESGDFDNSKNWFTTIEIYDNGEVFMPSNEIGVDWGYGMISIGNVYGNTSADDKEQYPWGTFADDVITFPANSLYLSMANYNDGGKYPSGTPTIIYLSKEAYIAANLKIEDFNNVEYEEIEGELSLFESAAYSDTWAKTISGAIDPDEENEESDYKSLFYISDLYADDFGLAFYNYDGVIRIPENQPTGIKFLGNDVFVSQSATHSSSVFTNFKGTDVYNFGLIFHYEDGTIVGDFAETFYYSEDAIEYTKDDFLGSFSLLGGTDPMDVEIAENAANSFVITGIEYAEEVEATFDPTELTLTIDPQLLADVVIEGDTYETIWYTVVGSGQNTTASLEFAFNLRGDLAVTDASVGSGYRVRVINVEDEDDASWISTNRNPVFVVSELDELETQSVESYTLRAATSDKSSGSGPNFFVQGKKVSIKATKPAKVVSGNRVN